MKENERKRKKSYLNAIVGWLILIYIRPTRKMSNIIKINLHYNSKYAQAHRIKTPMLLKPMQHIAYTLAGVCEVLFANIHFVMWRWQFRRWWKTARMNTTTTTQISEKSYIPYLMRNPIKKNEEHNKIFNFLNWKTMKKRKNRVKIDQQREKKRKIFK